MSCLEINSVIATSTPTINWVTDIFVPLISALIGGAFALLGVYITLKRDKVERKLEKEENARPFFNILDLIDSSTIESNNHVFCFSLCNRYQHTDSFVSANLINSDKVPFIIDKITICGKDYVSFRPEMVSKNLPFMIKLYYQDDPSKNDVFMYITDANYHQRIYKLICDKKFITGFEEI